MGRRKRFVTQTRVRRCRGDYQVKAYDQYGSRWIARDYYTTEREDALNTAYGMRTRGAVALGKHEEASDA